RKLLRSVLSVSQAEVPSMPCDPFNSLLLRAIVEHPNEDSPRLLFADRLAARGQQARADFIHLSVQLSRDAEPSRADRTRAADMLRASGTAWLPRIRVLDAARTETAGIVATRGEPGGMRFGFVRGFVSAIACTWEAWQREHKRIYWRQDLAAHCTGCGRRDAKEFVEGRCRTCGNHDFTFHLDVNAQPIQKVTLSE